MANIILIENDSRTESEIRRYIAEISEVHVLQSFPGVQEFNKMYCDPKALAKANKDRLNTVDVIIVKNTLVTGALPTWVQSTAESLKNGGFWPEGARPRFVLTQYEDDKARKSSLFHSYVDDLVYLPLDRLIFLQKLDIVLNLPEKISPRFLFNQRVEMPIEISKQAVMEKLSDVGFAIRNPVKLRPGVIGHFHFNLPGQEAGLSVYAKSIRSEPHPEIDKSFLVYFSYFGIAKATLMSIRRHLSSITGYRNFISEDPAEFTYNPDNVFLTAEERRRKTIALIDGDGKALEALRDAITDSFSQLRVVTETSYYMFLKRFFKSDTSGPVAPLALPEDFFNSPISFNFEIESRQILSLHSHPQESDLLLGHPAIELLKDDQWMTMFDESESKALFPELVNQVKAGKHVKQLMIAATPEGIRKQVQVILSPDEDGVLIEITPPEAEDYFDEDELESLEAIIIDNAVLPSDYTAWDRSFQELCKVNGLIPMRGRTEVLLLSEKTEPHQLKHLPINHYGMRPLDMRGLLFSLANAINSRFTKYSFNNIGWANTLLKVDIAKDVILENISEFGCTVIHPKPITPGTFLYLYGGIFSNAPNRNLCARCYHNEELDGDEEGFRCSFTYFGINDGFLKFTRSWIREQYANRKNQQRA